MNNENTPSFLEDHLSDYQGWLLIIRVGGSRTAPTTIMETAHRDSIMANPGNHMGLPLRLGASNAVLPEKLATPLYVDIKRWFFL